MHMGARGFPGGSVVENPPANAGDMSSIPGLGGSHMLQSNQVCAPQQLVLSLCTGAEPQPPSPCTIEPVLPNKRNHSNGKPVYHKQRKAHAAVKTQTVNQ